MNAVSPLYRDIGSLGSRDLEFHRPCALSRLTTYERNACMIKSYPTMSIVPFVFASVTKLSPSRLLAVNGASGWTCI
jgi:hypothetical protein